VIVFHLMIIEWLFPPHHATSDAGTASRVIRSTFERPEDCA
jgi:hypothetical protein